MLLHGRRIFAGGAALLVLGWLLSPFPAKTAESAQDGNRDGGSRPTAGARVPPRNAIETVHIDPARVLHAVPAIRGMHWQFRVGDGGGCSPDTGESGCYGSLIHMKKEHVALASRVGVTTFRCGIEQGSIEDLMHPGKYSEEGFARIDKFFRWCGEYHVNCIFDLHWPFGSDVNGKGFWESEKAQQRWCAAWREIARRYKDNPQVLAYEPYNEPSDPTRSLRWNELAKRVTAAIRQVDRVKPIIIDSKWAGLGEFVALEPTGDANTWYSFHFYPSFHCQKRLWDPDKGTYHYPGDYKGTWWNRRMMLELCQPALDFAQRHHVPLFVGEFGCVHEVPEMEDAVWLLDMISLFDEKNIGWTYYFFMSDAVYPYWQEHFDCGLYIYDSPHDRVRCFDRKANLMSDLMKLRGSVLDVAQSADQWITVYAVAEPTGVIRVYLANKSREKAKTIRLQLAGRKGAGAAKRQEMKRGGNGFIAAGDVPLVDGTWEATMEPLTIHRFQIAKE